jgi:hypothetical protein
MLCSEGSTVKSSTGTAALLIGAAIAVVAIGLGAGGLVGPRTSSHPSSPPETTAAASIPAASAVSVASESPRSTEKPSEAPASPVQLIGGTWASPADGTLVTNSLVLSAVPVPPTIGEVNNVIFTIAWDGSRVSCFATKPARGSTWNCLAHPASAGAPSGPLTLSFEVIYDTVSYDVDGVTSSQGGTRTVFLAPTMAPAGWTSQQLVDPATTCFQLAATVDSSGRYHVAAGCDGVIRYSTSAGDGAWSTRTFTHPPRRLDRDPQVATDGTKVYVAFSRVAVEDGGCGADGLRDVGVYYRHRELPDGRWSVATRIGELEDHLQSFRVTGGTLHATVRAGNGLVYFESFDGTSPDRSLVPGAVGETSLRVGSDGRARIVYQASAGLRYAVFDGAAFATSAIPSSQDGYAASVVLGKRNEAYAVWTSAYHGLGCADSGPFPEDGTYFGTDASGTWVTTRITPDVGRASITVDPATGQVHVVLAGAGGLMYYTKSTGDEWTPTSLSVRAPGSPIIRLDPTTGAIVILYSGDLGSYGSEGIYALTKP